MTPNNDTRLFLARVLAWPQDNDTPAYVNIHNTFEPSDKSTLRVQKGVTKYPWGGRACRSMDEAINYINWQTQNSGRDMYFCTSTQAIAERKDGKNNRVYYKALRSQENAVKMKALFIDIDLKDGDHGYATSEELFKALGAFLKFSGMPRPTMFVSTGGGIHVYWLMATPLDINEWMPLAYALNEAIRQSGMKCDSQVTIDAARVLRIPGTKNFKYDPAKPVTLMGNMLDFDYNNEKIEQALAPFKVRVPYSSSSPSYSILPPKAPIEGVSDLSAGIDVSNAQPVDLASMISECGFIAEAVAHGGQNYPNPLWNLTTLISTFTIGGSKDAHLMASGHPDYTQGETEQLFLRKQEEKLTRNLGWPTCSAISASGSSHCQACKHFPKGKSPLNFGTMLGHQPQGPQTNQTVQTAQHGQMAPAGNPSANPQTPAQTPSQPTSGGSITPGGMSIDPDLPNSYGRDNNGRVMRAIPSEDGSIVWHKVSDYPMSTPWLQKDPWTLHFTTTTEYNEQTDIAVSVRDVGSGEMRKNLQEQGFIIDGGSRGFTNFTEFLMAWIQKLQKEKNSVVSSVPFGWAVRNGKVGGFVFNGKLYTPSGAEIALNTDPELARQFTPQGNMQDWVDCALIVTDQQRPALDAILASAFAAPLVRFTGHSGLLLSAYSVESGIGKSTALKVAQAVWGDPVRAVQSLNDTQNSVLHKMGELKALPLYWDELQSEDDANKFVDTVFRLSLGREKSRMSAKMTQRTSGVWQTIMVAASNDSLMDAVATRNKATMAGVYRVFEYMVKPAGPGAVGQIDPTVAQRAISALHDNYGQVGLRYAKFLGENFPKVEKHIASMLKDISASVSMKQDERFWVSMIACLLLGASYSNHLNFTNINIKGLRDFLITTFLGMRKTRHSHVSDIKNVANVVNILGRFLNEKRAKNTVVTNIIYRAKGKPPHGTITTKMDLTRLDTVMVHVGVDDHTLRVGRSYLMDWLIQHNHPRHVFFQAMEEELGAKNVNARLGAGTAIAGASEHLIEIDLKSSNLIDFINET